MPLSSFKRIEKKEILELKEYDIPENISSILDESCVMCHNKDSKNMKAKLKLQLDDMDSLSKSKFLSKLSKIQKEVSKGEMPPEKFLEKNPDKKLSDEDKETLINWTKSYAAELME
jgi:hypothetical protein